MKKSLIYLFILMSIGLIATIILSNRSSPNDDPCEDISAQTGLGISIIKSALKGDSEAEYLIAKALLNTNNKQCDENTAFTWCKRSANQGNKNGQYLLGTLYSQGKGVQADEGKAFQLYLQSSINGNIQAAVTLAECYLYGIGTEKDEYLAVKWFKIASENGNIEGHVYLAKCFINGTGGLSNDMTKAMSLLIKAKQSGSDAAIKMLDALPQ